ncbi:MAG: glycosyltransferase family 4 protein, partial [Algoriphagus sp.]
ANFDLVVLLAPVEKNSNISPIEIPYEHPNLKVIAVPLLDFTGLGKSIKSFVSLPGIIFKMWMAMRASDHIHLRCPGNMGLLGCWVQRFFPKTTKTVKYAGNWDPQSSQPFTYRLQRKMLNNPAVFKNTRVLVYGHWPDSADHILAFFTASYFKKDIVPIEKKLNSPTEPLKLLFVGSLIKDKNPLLALKSLHHLLAKNISAHLDFCGDGDQYGILLDYIQRHKLEGNVTLRGNVAAAELKEFYKQADFLVFLSESEGWPKVVAEAMFFGCVPITTPVSCVAEMLNHGERGDLIGKDPTEVVGVINTYLQDPKLFEQKSQEAMKWSNKFTLELFEKEIKKLVYV